MMQPIICTDDSTELVELDASLCPIQNMPPVHDAQDLQKDLLLFKELWRSGQMETSPTPPCESTVGRTAASISSPFRDECSKLISGKYSAVQSNPQRFVRHKDSKAYGIPGDRMTHHLWIGICVALIGLTVASTGLLLNSLELDRQVDRGVDLLKSEKPDEAIAQFSFVIAKAPNDGLAYYYRGLAHNQTGDQQRAVTDLNSAIKLGHSNWQSIVILASLEEQCGNYDKAIELCTSALSSNQRNPQVYQMRALCQAQKLEFAEAIDDCNLALKWASDDSMRSRLFQQRAIAESAMNRSHLACADLTRVIAIHPNKDAFVQRGDQYRKEHQFNLAIKDYSSAIRIDKHSYCAFLGRAICEAKLDRNVEALHDLTSALAINRCGVEALIQRGTLYIQQQRWADAMSDLAIANALNPDIAEVVEKLAISSDKCNND